MGEAMETQDGVLALDWQPLCEPDFSIPLKWAEREGAFYVLSLANPRFCFEAGSLSAAVEKTRQGLIFYYENRLMAVRYAPPLPTPPALSSAVEG